MWLKIKSLVTFFHVGKISASWLGVLSIFFARSHGKKVNVQFENFLWVTDSYENLFANHHLFDWTLAFCLFSCSFLPTF